MDRKPFFFPVMVSILLMSSCANKTPEPSGIAVAAEPEIAGVSVWDRISTKGKPVRNSPTVTLLSLGERFLYLDSFAIDSSYNNTKFLKARLSDSSIVWVYDFASVLDATTAVVVNEVPLYRRPDLMTITSKRLNVMEIVAVSEEWDDWVKVVNEKKAKQGWIHKEHITYSTVDVAFALLVTRNLKEEEAEQRLAGLESLAEENPYPNTIFTRDLSTIIEEQRELLYESNSRDRWDDDRRDRNR